MTIGSAEHGVGGRNAGVAPELNPLALRLLLAESQRLIDRGKELWDVLEAFAELLLRP